MSNRKQRRSLRKKHQLTLDKYSTNLISISKEDYLIKTGKQAAENIISMFISKFFFVQVYNDNGYTRISVNRNQITNNGKWEENITWEELQAIKNEIGYSGNDCLEVYPKAGDEVNVSNMRHLWVMVEPVSFAWRKKIDV